MIEPTLQLKYPLSQSVLLLESALPMFWVSQGSSDKILSANWQESGLHSNDMFTVIICKGMIDNILDHWSHNDDIIKSSVDLHLLDLVIIKNIETKIEFEWFERENKTDLHMVRAETCTLAESKEESFIAWKQTCVFLLSTLRKLNGDYSLFVFKIFKPTVPLPVYWRQWQSGYIQYKWHILQDTFNLFFFQKFLSSLFDHLHHLIWKRSIESSNYKMFIRNC